MNTSIHSAAPHQLPIFITAPGFTDVLMVVMGVVLIITVLAVGNSAYTRQTEDDASAEGNPR
ncbi:hypothetical protein HZZ13_15855 [Bradyrhizobium sp. CNPSo 4010]|uniref:Uncharacterized protein n=1 Tax=Bradyrhizobium agreste TaxID=2751811 RepID=A0ABS0PPW1_9BRAD|nr:hypothetical protein [Bradyrhizobium agreste]MBH5399241.1 hypothetical protein [Bradyrhizobium agreste]